ncbi:MAG: response regulator [Acidobacteriota bacterium]|nr:response regulator [Acidobacteriota bacterium]
MNKKVLIVEDYTDSRSFLKSLIESYGYQVLEANNGEEAVKLAQYGHPDLILMDLALPTMDGLAATRVIKGLQDGAKTPIIAISAYGDSYYSQALEAGCDGLINKPFDFATLEPYLNKYLPHDLVTVDDGSISIP